MNRRGFALLAGVSAAALKLGSGKVQAAPDASLLQTTLTPFGAERAGNADGSIPAWTGGYTTVPADWIAGAFMPNPFENDAMLLKIDASNMAQYSDKLTVGVMAMMTRYPGFYIRIFPTHRPAAAPQDVYDNAALNVTRAQLSPAGPQMGFTNAVGAPPFPILDAANPLNAGAQCYWNHYTAWRGRAIVFRNQDWAISSGLPYMSNQGYTHVNYPYHAKGVTPENFGGLTEEDYALITGPSNNVGEEYLTTNYANPVATPNGAWELLNGQGRVRKTPDVSYDNPSSIVDGLANSDEFYGFASQPDRYDWHYLGKKEMYVPYTNNALFGMKALDVIKKNCLDPEIIRWELHRVHVVNAIVRQGQRDNLNRRTILFDEDTWIILAEDAYDANNVLLHVNLQYLLTRPDLPGTFYAQNTVNNLQTDDWTPMIGYWDEKEHPSIGFADTWPTSWYNPANMAASAQY